MSESYRINEPTIIHELIDGEVLAINNDSGAYYSIRGSGADVWQALGAGWPVSAIADAIGSRHPDEGESVSSKIHEFVLRARL